MAAVAVWDHKPSAEELLAARVARGWQPTPTSLKDGAKILGFAARLGEISSAGEISSTGEIPRAGESSDRPSSSIESAS